MPVHVTNPDPRQVQRLLPGLPAEAIPEVVSTARAVTYRAGDVIMGPKERPGPAVVTEGTVRLSVRSTDGREATLRLIGRGTIFGLTVMFYPAQQSVSVELSLVAVEKTTVILLERTVIYRLSQEYPEFTLNLVHTLVDWANALAESAGQFAFMTVRQRVAAHLLRLLRTRPENATPVAATTQQQLADAVGSVREVVARTLHDLRAEGIVSVSRAKVVILDRERLAEAAFDVT